MDGMPAAPAQTGSESFEVTVGGKVYVYGAPTLGAMNEFVGWVRSETIRRTNEAIRGAGLTPVEIQGYREAAVRRASTLTVGSPELSEFLGTGEGVARMLWAVIADKQGGTLADFTTAVLAAKGEEATRIGEAFRRVASLARLVR